MHVNKWFSQVMRKGRQMASAEHTRTRDLLPEMLGAIIVLSIFFAVLFSFAPAHAQVIQPADIRTATNILYAEAAIDPQGWAPKLNTYYKARRSGETLVDSMKRVSSAYRTKSPQYRLAASGQLNSYEKKVYARITAVVRDFRPDPGWRYVHHENLKLYSNRAEAMAHLRKAWGPDVDYKNCVQIGLEHYFAKCPQLALNTGRPRT